MTADNTSNLTPGINPSVADEILSGVESLRDPLPVRTFEEIDDLLPVRFKRWLRVHVMGKGD
jgi:hypothetical protein